ncbi:hypothetical protein RI845_14240 [Thalassotalea nanhaiensis]|uniref:Orphan protein n=1 Tax=Thalassotalea nanhaiensis TaxID=3065648 RepID=A0ABY9TFY1_9GAMM|nr:hypothetical protein RI845_14240 [Colwelliaceae bacterium SQ345]
MILYKFNKQLVAILLAVVTLLTSNLAAAHQQKEAYSTILFNDRTQNIEVSHRFYIHDAEHALVKLLNKHADLIGSVDTQKEFAEYIQNKFRLLDDNKQLLPLGSVGFEIEGKFFWVYQEIKQPEVLTAVYVKMAALQDVWPGQINQINVEHSDIKAKSKKSRSVRISEHDDWQRITVD